MLRIFEFGELGEMDPSFDYKSPVKEEEIVQKKKNVPKPVAKPKVLPPLPEFSKPKNAAERAELNRKYLQYIGLFF